MRLCGTNRANLTKKVPIPIPTLSLDFINNKYRYGDNQYQSPSGITGYNFQNVTGGFAYDPISGLQKYFPANTPRITQQGLLIESSATNLIASSQAFSNSAVWIYKFLSTLTDNTVIAPDGTLTGCSFVGTGANADFHSYAITVAANTNYTLSCWIKLGTGALPTAQMRVTTTAGITISPTAYFTGVTSSGWTRISTTVNTGANTQVLLYPVTQIPQAGTYYIWGCQFELGNIATSYIPTYRSITNICQQSNFLANSPWNAISASSAINNSAIAPDGSFSASTITTTNNLHGYRQAITVTANTTYTFSFYAKLGTMTTAAYSVYNISQTTELVVATSYTNKVNNYGWNLVQVTFTTPVGCTSIGVYPVRDSQSTGTIFIWGCQLQTGTTATNLIPCSPAVTNNFTRSQLIGSTGWTNTGLTGTANNAIAPDGTTTASLLTSTATSPLAALTAKTAITITSGVAVNFSFYVKSGTSRYCAINVNRGSGQYYTVIFDLLHGLVVGSIQAGTVTAAYPSIIRDKQGYFRIGLGIIMGTTDTTYVASLEISNGSFIGSDDLGNVTNNIGETIYAWGAQFESNYGTNQYVVTTTVAATLAAQTSATLAEQTSATRNSDMFYYTSALGLNRLNTKAVVVKGIFNTYINDFNLFANFNNGGDANFLGVGSYLSDGNTCNYLKMFNIVQKACYLGNKINPSTLIRNMATSFGDNKLVISQNGLGITDANLGNGSFAGIFAFNRLNIGTNLFSQTTFPCIYGYIRQLNLYGNALSLNQLNTLSSLNNN